MNTLSHNANLTQKELILSLIKAEMRTYKLITGLMNAGAEAGDFYADLGTVILKLMDFDEADRDDLYGFYHKTMENLSKVELADFFKNLNFISVDFYNELLLQRIAKQEKKLTI
ncbi:MAG: hypothetical protein ACK4ND_05790 [Cytophagaceae bacterium]